MFKENFPANTQVWNGMSHWNDCWHRGVIWVTYGCYNSNLYKIGNISHQEDKCSTMCMSRADNQLIATSYTHGYDLFTCGNVFYTYQQVRCVYLQAWSVYMWVWSVTRYSWEIPVCDFFYTGKRISSLCKKIHRIKKSMCYSKVFN